MELRYRPRFQRDLRQIADNDLNLRIERVIEALKAASTLSEVSNVRRVTGWERYYRIRVGSYRIGIELEGNVVVLHRFGHRREIYRIFP